MTKQEFIDLIDIQDGDKIYYIRERTNQDGTINIHRMNRGFDLFGLVGRLQKTINDIFKQFDKESDPIEIITKQYIDENIKNENN
jgi:hypothetical protein